MNRDRIYLQDIHADIIVGILPHELEMPQPILVNVVLICDCAIAAESDDIRDAVDYAVLHDEIIEHIHSTQYGLIESLANGIAQICLKDTRVIECTVRVDKLEALEYAENVAVEITRSQG